MPELSSLRRNGINYDLKDVTAREAIEKLQQNGTGDPVGNTEFFKIGTPIPANADLNTYKTDGKYYQTGDVATLLNCPTQYNFALYVLTRTTNNAKTQIIYDYYGKMYIRGTNGSSWRNWESYLTKSDTASIVEDVLSALPTWTGGSY